MSLSADYCGINRQPFQVGIAGYGLKQTIEHAHLDPAVVTPFHRLVSRHSWTDYDQLLRSRIMTRDEARAYIAPQVKEILQVWSKPALRLRLVRRQGKV